MASVGDIAWRAVHDGFNFDLFLVVTMTAFYLAIILDTYFVSKEVVNEQNSTRPKTS